jgi:hypothetical protein
MTTTTQHVTRFATSADGTRIAYEVTGAGPAVVLVDGAMCQRAMGPARGLASALAAGRSTGSSTGSSTVSSIGAVDGFTVYAYDRRGRGESGAGSTPYSPVREVEDLAAVLEAARQGVPMGRLVVYESPFVVDDTRPANDLRLPERVQTMVEEGRRGDAVRTFLRTVGVPAPVVVLMRLLPAWKQMTGVAHTLPYDLSMVVALQQGRPLPAGYYDGVAAETLVIAGGRSPAWMRNAQAAVAEAVPLARLETLAGQTHMVKPKAVAPVVAAFLSA